MYATFFLCAVFHVQMDKGYSLKFLGASILVIF